MIVAGSERYVDDAIREAANAEQPAVNLTASGGYGGYLAVVFKDRPSRTVNGILDDPPSQNEYESALKAAMVPSLPR